MNKIIKNSDLIFDDGGKVTVDQYTSQEIKKAYVSIRIRYKSGRAADDKFFNKYELTSFDEKPFEELKDHKLKGILGVSTSNYNLSEWLVHRECLVVMPFDKFKELNDTEQIQYYDADYLSKNGFDALHRLFDRKERTDEDYTAILQRIFRNISQELQLEGMSMSQGSEYTNIYVIADWFNIYNSGKFTKYVANRKRINSPEELAQIVIDYANSEQSKIDYSYNRQTENLSIESIIQPIKRGIVQSGKQYVQESEWLIKNKELVIPENSQLFFVIKDYENMRDKYEEYISRYNLESSYKIAFINQKNLNQLQSKRFNFIIERSKEEFEKAKTFTQKRIVKAIQKIQNDVIEEWTTKLIEEFKESYSNEVFKDYDGNSYSDNILEVPSAIIYFDSLMLKFIDIYDARVEYIAQTKSKYAFSDIFNDFSDYIDTLRSKEGEEELEVSTNYNRVYKYDILQKLYYYARHADYEKFGQKIKSEIGSDLYRYFSKDEVGFKKGGELKKTKMNKKILCPVGTEVQTLIFSKDEFTEKSAKDWAKNHDFKYGYIDEKENTYRIRQQEPSDFENMRTIEMTDGVKAVIGCPIDKYNNGGEMQDKWVTCPKCGGTGELELYRHINAGVCFECGGKGVVPNYQAKEIMEKMLLARKKYEEKSRIIAENQKEKDQRVIKRKNLVAKELNEKIIELRIKNTDLNLLLKRDDFQTIIRFAERQNVKNGEEFIEVIKDFGKNYLNPYFQYLIEKYLREKYNYYGYLNFKEHINDLYLFDGRDVTKEQAKVERELQNDYIEIYHKIGRYDDDVIEDRPRGLDKMKDDVKGIDKKIEIKSEKPKDNTPLDSNDIYEFVETKHTKTGDTIYVLRIKKRLSPAEYKTVEANVKLIRGYYSGFVKGFVLKSKITKNEIERLFEGTSLANDIEKKDVDINEIIMFLETKI